MRKLFPLLFLLVFLPGSGCVRAQMPSSGGIIILKGPPESATAFDSIAWVDTSGGYVADQAGNKTPFVTSEVGRIIYFDQAYYDEVDHNQYWVGWRVGLQNRELVLPPVNNISLSPEDLPGLKSEEQTLEDIVERFSSGRPLIAPLLATLQNDINQLSGGSVLRNGKWMTQQEAAAVPSATPVLGQGSQAVTFTTRDGTKFTNVQVSVTDSGLSILTSDGGATVTFAQLPDDLSPFPPVIRTKIYAAQGKNSAGQIIPSGPPPKDFFAKDSATPAPPSASLAVTTTTDLNTDAVVLIKGDYAQGTGFLAQTPGGPVVITNLHVIAGNPNLKIFTTSGQEIVPLSLKGASDRDLAMFAIQDNHYTYLPLAPSVDKTSQPGDATVIPGNSEGGEVTLKTNGTVLGIGPQRIEFSNPVFHGNSGGPVFDVKSGNVIAVASFATKMTPQDEVDSNSFSNSNSAIKGPIRYFGWRLDTVPAWVTYDQSRFVNEVLFLKDMDDVSLAIDSFINGKSVAESHAMLPGKPGAKFYEAEQKLREAYDNYHSASGDRQAAAQELVWTLGTLADDGFGAVHNPDGFYSYDQELAKHELEYRSALKTEISDYQSKINTPGPNSGL
jgi:S1-C subfamily serine protease